MQKQELLALLVQGMESWNTQVDSWTANREHPGRLDLTRTNIADLLQRAGRLTQSGRPDLRGYNLNHADFSGSWLAEVDLSAAKCFVTKFEDAWLKDADLTDAEFSFVEFKGARLGSAILCGTTFDNSPLTGVDLEGSNSGRPICSTSSNGFSRFTSPGRALALREPSVESPRYYARSRT